MVCVLCVFARRPSRTSTPTTHPSRRGDAKPRPARYGSNFRNWVLFHANDYGRAGLEASKARTAKMNLLRNADELFAEVPNPSRRAEQRWHYVPTGSAPKRRQNAGFPKDTLGG